MTYLVALLLGLFLACGNLAFNSLAIVSLAFQLSPGRFIPGTTLVNAFSLVF